jgi:hypothetical protein
MLVPVFPGSHVVLALKDSQALEDCCDQRSKARDEDNYCVFMVASR